MAATDKSRFVIIEGVQYSRDRAVRLGLVKADPAAGKSPLDGPPSGRARAAASARKGGPIPTVSE